MRAADVMQANVITVTPGTRLVDAARVAREHRVRHLPVVDDGRLVGIVSERELRMAFPSPATPAHTPDLFEALGRLTAADFMRRVVVTATPDTPIEDVAQLMLEHRIGAVVVNDGGRLSGIVTVSEILRLFIEMCAASAPSPATDARRR